MLLFFRFGDAIDISADVSAADQKERNLENLLMFIYVGIVSGCCAWIYTSLFKVGLSSDITQPGDFLSE